MSRASSPADGRAVAGQVFPGQSWIVERTLSNNGGLRDMGEPSRDTRRRLDPYMWGGRVLLAFFSRLTGVPLPRATPVAKWASLHHVQLILLACQPEPEWNEMFARVPTGAFGPNSRFGIPDPELAWWARARDSADLATGPFDRNALIYLDRSAGSDRLVLAAWHGGGDHDLAALRS